MPSELRSVSIHRTVRPIRVAFLVRPSDDRTLGRILEALTCTWGGILNPIVPWFTRVPRWWEARPLRSQSSKQILHGYLKAFDPDYVVLPEQQPLGVDFPQERTLGIEEYFPSTGAVRLACGLSSLPAYRQFHNRELRFVKRDPPTILNPTISDDSFQLLDAACFGRFPAGEGRQDHARAFSDGLGAEDRAVDAENFLRTLTDGSLNPLVLGAQSLRWHQHGWRAGPYLFCIRARSPRDIIDYWNLRAFGYEVLPIPDGVV